MTHEEAERLIMDVIEAQFDIHAMDPEDFAEMWVGISAVLRRFAGTDIRSPCAHETERSARPASCDRNPKGEKPQALSAKHESAVGSEASETPNPLPPKAQSCVSTEPIVE
jgi:hypothetical protein